MVLVRVLVKLFKNIQRMWLVVSSFLEGVRYYPSGDTFKWKMDELNKGQVSAEELKLLQYASLFNIVMFNHDTLKPEELDTLTDELNNLEYDLNIRYVEDKGLEYDKERGMMKKVPGKSVSRERFVKNRIEQYKNGVGSRDAQERKDSELFNSSCEVYQKDNVSYELHPGFDGRVSDSVEYFSIEYSGGTVDLSDSRGSYGGSYFLTQVMTGKTFDTYDDYTSKKTEYGSMDLYRIAKNAEVKLAKTNEVEGEKPTIDLTALRTIASRQRKDKVKETFNKLKSNIYQFLHPKKEKEQEQNQEF